MATRPDGTTATPRVDATSTDPVAHPASAPLANAPLERASAAAVPPTEAIGALMVSVRAAMATDPHVHQAAATALMTGVARAIGPVGPRASVRAARATDPPTGGIVVPRMGATAGKANDPVGAAASARTIAVAGRRLDGTTAPGAGPVGMTRSAAAGPV